MWWRSETASGWVSAMACARATMTRNTIPAMIEHGTKPSFRRKPRPAMVSVQRQGLILRGSAES